MFVLSREAKNRCEISPMRQCLDTNGGVDRALSSTWNLEGLSWVSGVFASSFVSG